MHKSTKQQSALGTQNHSFYVTYYIHKLLNINAIYNVTGSQLFLKFLRSCHFAKFIYRCTLCVAVWSTSALNGFPAFDVLVSESWRRVVSADYMFSQSFLNAVHEVRGFVDINADFFRGIIFITNNSYLKPLYCYSPLVLKNIKKRQW